MSIPSNIPFYKLSEEEFAKKKFEEAANLKNIKDIYLYKNQGLLFVYAEERKAKDDEIFCGKSLNYNEVIFN